MWLTVLPLQLKVLWKISLKSPLLVFFVQVTLESSACVNGSLFPERSRSAWKQQTPDTLISLLFVTRKLKQEQAGLWNRVEQFQAKVFNFSCDQKLFAGYSGVNSSTIWSLQLYINNNALARAHILEEICYLHAACYPQTLWVRK